MSREKEWNEIMTSSSMSTRRKRSREQDKAEHHHAGFMTHRFANASAHPPPHIEAFHGSHILPSMDSRPMLNFTSCRRRKHSLCIRSKIAKVLLWMALLFLVNASDVHAFVPFYSFRYDKNNLLGGHQSISITERPPFRLPRCRRTLQTPALVTIPSTSTTKLRLISSIRSWWSQVMTSSSKEEEDSKQNSRRSRRNHDEKDHHPPIFFKRNPYDDAQKHKNYQPGHHNQTHNLQNQTKHSDKNTTSTSNNKNWVNLLQDDRNASTASSTTNGNLSTYPSWMSPASGNTSSSAKKTTSSKSKPRQVVQNGIFNPSSSLWQFPDYTSAWANSLSSSLQNTTHNAWNKVTFTTPMPMIPPTTASISSRNSSSNLMPGSRMIDIPSHLKPNDTITVADLQAILQRNAVLSQSNTYTQKTPFLKENSSQPQPKGPLPPSQSLAATVASPLLPTDPSTAAPVRRRGGVAFPQASVLDYQSLQRGTAFVGGMTGMIVATTLLPNLWLMGLLVGGIYGHDLCGKPDEPPPSNIMARTLLGWGRKVATVALQIMDSFRTLWFLYKTGQLSYEYYKRYEDLDKRFAIQSKMDAWNARFQEGKRNFDKWEQENEIGRTVLAGVRTIWLVDERRRRRAKQKSRYRIVQYIYDTKYWMTRWARKLLNSIRSSNFGESMKDYIEGVRTDLLKSGKGSWGARIGAVLASLIAVNITGALFAISPTLLALLASAIAIAWPSWPSELASRIQTLTLETRARGRGDDPDTEDLLQKLLAAASDTASRTSNTARLLGRYDKMKYHYFKRQDGTKRYYRTGQSLFTGRQSKKTSSNSSNGNSKMFLWPWSKPQPTRRTPVQEQWGLLSMPYRKSNRPKK